MTVGGEIKLLLMLLAYFFGNQAVACPDVIGTWKSSKEMSMDYDKNHAQLTDAERQFLPQILGQMKLTYTESFVRLHGSHPIQVTVDGEEYEFHFDESVCRYEMLSCNKRDIKLKTTCADDEPVTSTLHFVGEDVYWSSPQEFMTDTREYFVRISPG